MCNLVAVILFISGILNTGKSQMAKPEEEEKSLTVEEKSTNIPPPDPEEILNITGMPEEAVPFVSQVAGHSDHSHNCTVGKWVFIFFLSMSYFIKVAVNKLKYIYLL